MSAQHIYKLLHLSLVLHMLWRKRITGKWDLAELLPQLKYMLFYPGIPGILLPLFKHHSLEGKGHYFIMLHISCVRGGEKSVWRGRSAHTKQYHSTEGIYSRNAYHVYKHQCKNSQGHDSLWLKAQSTIRFWTFRCVKTQGACLKNSKDSHKHCEYDKVN